MAEPEKPEIQIPSDRAPSYQLELEDITVGDGDEAVSGRIVEVHYVGVSWQNGQQFDASWDRGQPFSFVLSKGSVIPGWDHGVVGMKVGGRRELVIPPSLAYGSVSPGNGIAANDTLIFVVDLVKIG